MPRKTETERKRYKDFLETLKTLSKTNASAAKFYAEQMGWASESESNGISAKDRIEYAEEFRREIIGELKREREVTGCCPLCGFREILCDTPRLSSEPEHIDH